MVVVTSAQEFMFSSVSLCVSVCLSVSTITHNLQHMLIQRHD